LPRIAIKPASRARHPRDGEAVQRILCILTAVDLGMAWHIRPRFFKVLKASTGYIIVVLPSCRLNNTTYGLRSSKRIKTVSCLWAVFEGLEDEALRVAFSEGCQNT
jgi:hypothetical protein